MAWLLLLPAVPTIFWLVACLIERLVYPDDGQRRLARYYNDACRRGRSAEEACEELTLRTALARVRRLATADTIADPSQPIAHIRARIAAEAETLSKVDPRVGKRFVAWAGSLPIGDVLYRDALIAISGYDNELARLKRLYGPVKPLSAEPEKRTPDADDFAALRTLK